jgi:hypothetical protein
MSKLTTKQLEKIIKEEMQSFQAQRLKIKQRPTTVFLFESRRSYVPARQVSLNFLLEQHDKGLITDKGLIASWERSIFWEADRLQEGFGDTMAAGWEKAKEIGGTDVGELARGAIDKIKNWLQSALDGALRIMAKGSMLFDKGISILTKIWMRVQSWCREHTLLCGVAKICLILVVVIGTVIMMTSDAEAAIRLPGGKIASQFDIDGAKGFIRKMAETAQKGGADVFDVTRLELAGTDILNKAHAAKEVVDLKDLQGPGATLAKEALTGFRELVGEAMKGQAENNEMAEAVMKMANYGKGLVVEFKAGIGRVIGYVADKSTIKPYGS